MKNFTLTLGPGGIALVGFDVPDMRLNVISHMVIAEINELAARVRDDPQILGAVIFSTKASGLGAGADLSEMIADIDHWAQAATQAELREGVTRAGAFSASLRALETCGKPVACIAHGATLGGAFELLLAAHHRIAVEGPNLNIALPEATIGLMPGAGATQRLPRIAGLVAALPWLLDGVPVPLTAALESGIVHAVASSVEAAIDTASAWVTAGGSAVAPWDVKGFTIPGGGVHSPVGYQRFGPLVAARIGGQGNAMVIGNILKAVYEGSQIPIDAALRVESRYFFNTARTEHARAAIGQFFADRI